MTSLCDNVCSLNVIVSVIMSYSSFPSADSWTSCLLTCISDRKLDTMPLASHACGSMQPVLSDESRAEQASRIFLINSRRATPMTATMTRTIMVIVVSASPNACPLSAWTHDMSMLACGGGICRIMNVPFACVRKTVHCSSTSDKNVRASRTKRIASTSFLGFAEKRNALLTD